MIVEKSEVTKYRLIELERLDPITVICEDLGPRQGKIIIECYGESWSAYWGGMGNRTIAEFFCSCDEHYLAKNLSSVRSHVVDCDNLDGWLKKEVIKLRREFEIESGKARELWGEIELKCVNDEGFLSTEEGSDLINRIIGNEWWHELPEKPNNKYTYLCRIINAVKYALKMEVGK